jgi:hypothetical protein
MMSMKRHESRPTGPVRILAPRLAAVLLLVSALIGASSRPRPRGRS